MPVAVPDNAGRTAARQSPAEVLGVPAAVLAEKLTGHLVREIMLRGSGGGPLAPLADQLNHDLTHLQGQRVEGILARLVALVIATSAPSSGAGDPAREAGPARPAAAVRISEADPRRLGVHAAISVSGVAEEVPPEYVPRDVDADEHGVRARVAAGAEHGGFVLLVGGSSVGKTRCGVEAVKALLPDWWLVHPAGPTEVTALAQAPSPRTVVWLDELQRYLDDEHGLTGAVVRALLNSPDPVLIIGTLWPDRYVAYTQVPAPGGADPRGREREVLDLADVIRIGAAFSPAEQGRARAAASRDPRLREALGAAGYGLTQTLAAAPQLVARWEDAQAADLYAWAVLTAALDAARLGVRRPLSAGFLRAAAPGYCTPRQKAEAPENWFEQALAYATQKVHGAAAALAPAGADMGKVAGFTVADYLLHHAGWERRAMRVPASTWDALLSHVQDPADAVRVANGARNRLLYRYATSAYQRAADAGNVHAARRLADLLAERGEVDGLRARTDAGDEHAAVVLVDLLAERGDVDGLRARADADADDFYAARRLADLLAERGDLDGAVQILGSRADAGNRMAVTWLTRMLARRGDVERLRARADAGDGEAAWRLAEVLAGRGDLDGAEQILRPHADAGDQNAAVVLADLLAERGDLDALRALANAGDEHAAEKLADLLAERGDLDGAERILGSLADAGDEHAARRLADLLAERGDLDGLRARVDAGNGHAAWRLADLLAERGDLDALRALADAGDGHAAELLIMLLAGRRDLDAALQVVRARADANGWTPALYLAMMLCEYGDLDGAEQILRPRADTGDPKAATHLADLLARRGDLDGAERILRPPAAAGDHEAARQLAILLARRGDLDGAERILRPPAAAGDHEAARQLAILLAERGNLDALHARANDDWQAAQKLTDLLTRRGDLDGLRARADAGDDGAARRLADLLAERGDVDGLRARVDTGDWQAAARLAGALAEQGQKEEAGRLRRFGLNPDGAIASS